MKKILITGKNSYIGNSFEKWLSQWPQQYQVDKISIRNNQWENINFGKYDSIFHVAGIAHQDTKADKKDLYYRVNRDLTIEIAKKAKFDGVKQFIFMSSMIVYGESSKIGKYKVITKDTKPQPVNFYGKSKLEAEKNISLLQDSNFNIAILRPPMIYGKSSKGNYPILSKFAKTSPVFPNIVNNRSMLYINNLTEFIRYVVDKNLNGVLHPQNKEYVSTSNLVVIIGEIANKRIHLTKLFNPMIYLLSKRIAIMDKIFGSLCYDLSMSEYEFDYNIYSFKESIYRTEEK